MNIYRDIGKVLLKLDEKDKEVLDSELEENDKESQTCDKDKIR